VAEDNPTNQLVALRMLERLGHQANAVGNGAEAMAALHRTRYDLVLMDVMMPEMDGLTATRRIRAAERPESRVTIVGLTAGSAAETLAECLAAGMDAVTTKPVTADWLRSVIAEGLDAAARRPRSHPAEVITPRVTELMEALGPDALREILATFDEDTNLRLISMREAAARGETTVIQRLAHSVTGAAGNVGATALAVRAGQLEREIGSLGESHILAEIDAMQADLDAALTEIELMAAVPDH
jgi:two-component system, sensor histidine kinase and response regulator